MAFHLKESAEILQSHQKQQLGSFGNKLCEVNIDRVELKCASGWGRQAEDTRMGLRVTL